MLAKVDTARYGAVRHHHISNPQAVKTGARSHGFHLLRDAEADAT